MRRATSAAACSALEPVRAATRGARCWPPQVTTTILSKRSATPASISRAASTMATACGFSFAISSIHCSWRAMTAGCTMAFNSAMRPPSKASIASLARSMLPSALTICRPKCLTTSWWTACPGAMSWWAISSAWITRAPRRSNNSATRLLPLARPPVRPTRSTLAPPHGHGLAQAGAAPQLHRLDSIAHQHGDGERADAAGHRRERAGNLGDFRMHIAHQGAAILGECLRPLRIAGEEFFQFGATGDLVYADVNHGGARMDQIASDHAGAADGSHQNLGSAADRLKIARLGVTNRHRGIGVQQQHGHRFADDVAASHHHGIFAGHLDAAAPQNLHAPGGRAGHQSGTLGGEIAHVDRMKSIHVFFRRHRQ